MCSSANAAEDDARTVAAPATDIPVRDGVGPYHRRVRGLGIQHASRSRWGLRCPSRSSSCLSLYSYPCASAVLAGRQTLREHVELALTTRAPTRALCASDHNLRPDQPWVDAFPLLQAKCGPDWTGRRASRLPRRWEMTAGKVLVLQGFCGAGALASGWHIRWGERRGEHGSRFQPYGDPVPSLTGRIETPKRGW